MDEARLYLIAPDFGKFDEMSRYYPGVAPDGTQVLVVQGDGLVCAHRFDADGRYLGREFRTTDWADALSWTRELGLTPATIRVRKFSTPVGDGPTLAIRDQPRHFEEGEMGSEEDEEQLLGWWRDIGGFVLFWDGHEYTLNGKGLRFQ